MHVPTIGTTEASRTLVLAPTASLANPRAWKSVSNMNIRGRYDEVHCSGGGSLLLFLMACAGKAPRLRAGGKVFFHGDLVYPTPESCKQWLSREAIFADDLADAYEWRAAALSLGVGGELTNPSHQWLEPIARSVTMGRWSTELVSAFNMLKTRSEEKGRLIHLKGQDLVKGLFKDDNEEEEEEPARVLVRCGENECELLDGDSSVTFRA